MGGLLRCIPRSQLPEPSALSFLIQNGRIYLVQKPDSYTDGIDAKLNLGIVLLHFSAVASQWAGKLVWQFEEESSLSLPEGYHAVASVAL